MHDAAGRRTLGLALVLLLVMTLAAGCSAEVQSGGPTVTAADTESSDAVFAKAFAERAERLEVEGRGAVQRLLPDDQDGGRHQRFIVELASGQTLLVSHNIDVAPRVEGLRTGDPVAFKGVYEWNAQGGLVHWTHHDPDGSHAAGWIEHGGMIYQ